MPTTPANPSPVSKSSPPVVPHSLHHPHIFAQLELLPLAQQFPELRRRWFLLRRTQSYHHEIVRPRFPLHVRVQLPVVRVGLQRHAVLPPDGLLQQAVRLPEIPVEDGLLGEGLASGRQYVDAPGGQVPPEGIDEQEQPVSHFGVDAGDVPGVLGVRVGKDEGLHVVLGPRGSLCGHQSRPVEIPHVHRRNIGTVRRPRIGPPTLGRRSPNLPQERPCHGTGRLPVHLLGASRPIPLPFHERLVLGKEREPHDLTRHPVPEGAGGGVGGLAGLFLGRVRNLKEPTVVRTVPR
mmetsp:Transcript_6552/g.13741  ORF Transcript_6552/g.13741 Transcript_6552/m.13741 type:complete len:292 (+) Transcript_6552:47-922(+)